MTNYAPGDAPATEPKSGLLAALLAKEPVLAAFLATWVVTNVGAFLVGHTHLVTTSTWSGVATTLVPLLTGVALGGLGWLTRKVVTPVLKHVPIVDRYL